MISINGVKITPLIFSDKTSQVWQLSDALLESLYKEGMCTIKWEFESEAEFIHLAQLKTLLDTRCTYVTLDMPYLPYARQDKWISNKTTFALRTFATLLNTLNFTEVHVLDAHNNLRANMINNLVDNSPRQYIEHAIEAVGANCFLYPDESARQRYESLMMNHGIFSTYAIKKRDPSTGAILSLNIQGDVKNKVVLMIDDLVDAGNTFILAARDAYAHHAKEVHLYTTHGIYSKGMSPLHDARIHRIFNCKGEVTSAVRTS